jgi:hypothetical protein
MSRKCFFVGATMMLALSLQCLNAFAQTSNASLGGTVQDSSKAFIPGVTIKATNTGTGVVTITITNESGSYHFASLLPGHYDVSAELPGFRTAAYKDVELGTAAQLRLDFALEVGNAQQTIEVVAAADSLLRESSPSIGDVLPEYKLHELPLVGTNVLDLAKILPGYRQSQFSLPGFGVFDTFAGQDLNSVNVTRDGLSVTDGRYAATTYGLSTTTNINPDMVGEVRLILTPVDAELGRGTSQIQIMTKSGTNQFNGTAVWNIQNTALNANTWTNNHTFDANGNKTTPDWRNTHDLVFTYGGPIKKNKTFFFGSLELRSSRTRTQVTNTVLTDSARQGIFRYWDNWNPWNPFQTNNTPIPGTNATAVYPSVDLKGNLVRPATNPDGSPYTGSLRCFSVFGNTKADGSQFTQADCPGGIAVGNATPWDTLRTSMDATGYIQKIMDAMPHANAFTAGDGLNTAGFQWVRGRSGSGGANAAVGIDPNVNAKSYNIKIDHNFNSKHRIAGNLSYQPEDSPDFFTVGFGTPLWPDALYGQTTRRPRVLTVTGTSTLRSNLLNEARFGIRYEVTGEFPAWQNTDPSVVKATEQWILKGGSTSRTGALSAAPGFPAGVYPVAFTPAGITNGALAISGMGLGNTTPLYDYADTLSWARGKHALKFGAELRLTRSNGYNGDMFSAVTGGASPGLTSSLAGATNFATQLPGFLAAVPTGTGITGLAAARADAANLLYFLNASISATSTNYWINNADDVKNGTWQDMVTAGRKYRNQVANEFSAFVKDDWKATSRLTLNLGVRYDYFGSPYIQQGFTAAPVGLGAGLFGVDRVVGGGTFDKWLTPGNTYLSGYGSNVSAANALQCVNGAPSQSALIPSSNCDPAMLTSVEFVGPNTPNPGKQVIPGSLNIGPAVGFAYQVPWFGAGKTVVRGGYQINYGTSGRNGIGTDALLGSAPGNATTPALNTNDQAIAAILATRALNLTDLQTLIPVRPTITPGGTVPIYGRSIAFEAYDPNYSSPYTESLTLQVTRSVRRNMTVDVRYVGTLARKQDTPINLNIPNVYTNPELLQALIDTRAGLDSPLFDQMFAGLDIHGTAGTGYGPVGTVVNNVLQRGSAQLRRNSTFSANLANGNFVGVINSLMDLSTATGLQALPAGLAGVSARILRNGCDRLANGLYNPALPASNTNIPTRCFPEDYFKTNPQLNSPGLFGGGATYHGSWGNDNYHGMQVQYTLRPTSGISVQTTWNWSKTLGDNYTTFVNPLNRHADYSTNYSTTPQEFRANGTIELPIGPNKLLFGNSKGVFARFLEKWQTGFIFSGNTGNPRDAFAAQMLYAAGGGNQPQARPDIVGPWVDPKTNLQWNGPNNNSGYIFGYPNPYVTFPDPQCAKNVAGTVASNPDGFSLQSSCTLNGLAKIVPAGTPGAFVTSDGRSALPMLVNPLPGHQGSEGPRLLRLPGRYSLDANLSKSFKLTESKQLRIRVDATNVLNHPLPGEPTFNIQSATFGQVTTKSGSRVFQAQARLNF